MSSSPAISSNIIRPVIAATRISPTGRRRSTGSREFKANALVPGRGAALATPDKVRDGIDGTRDFLSTLYNSAKDSVAKGLSLKDAFAAARQAMDPKFAKLRHLRALHAVQRRARL